MQNRSIAVTAAALMVIASTAGCVEETKPERARNARITVSGKTQTTQELSCRQFGWSMIIETKSGPARTRSLLQIGGEQPIAKTVDIQNFDGFSGVADEGAGNANVSLVNNSTSSRVVPKVLIRRTLARRERCPSESKPPAEGDGSARQRTPRRDVLSRLQLIPNDFRAQTLCFRHPSHTASSAAQSHSR